MPLVSVKELLGCNAKVDAERLLYISGGVDIAELGVDSSVVSIAGIGLRQTVDTVYPFCSDIDLFATAALSHCSNDLICAGGMPVSVTMALGVGSELEDIEARDLSGAIAKQLSERGINLANCHTFNSAHTSITFSLTAHYDKDLSDVGDSSFAIYITKPLGFSAACYGENKLIGSSSIFQGAGLGHFSIVGAVSKYCLSCSTDISGYGFLGHAAIAAARYGLALEFIAGDIPVATEFEELLNVQGPTCSAVENARFFSDYVDLPRASGLFRPYAYFNGETNGPLLLFVDEINKSKFEAEMELNGMSPIEVGYGVSSAEISVKIRI